MSQTKSAAAVPSSSVKVAGHAPSAKSPSTPVPVKTAGSATIAKDAKPALRTGGDDSNPDVNLCNTSLALPVYLIVLGIACIIIVWVMIPCMSTTAKIVFTIIGILIFIAGLASAFWRRKIATVPQ